jgi:cyclohexa-1,5-dienecarbonyl-CoA hydratase
MHTIDKVASELLDDEQILVLRLDGGKGNVLDAQMLRGLDDAFEDYGASPQLKAIVLGSTGPHFSFGASVAEHVRERAPTMLRQLHALARRMVRLGVPTLASVRGACLGGGLELASLCTWIFASPGASFAQPEIKLGVFPPLASVLLPWRLGAGRALDLCVSGRSLAAAEAERIGLVHAIADDPDEAALSFARTHLVPRSASSLRFAERAARALLAAHLGIRLDSIERLYLDELMATDDANEGIASFLERRTPRWTISAGTTGGAGGAGGAAQ